MSFRILFAKQTNFFSLRKSFSSTVTTPIFYLNSDPHIGHLYTLVLADCIARWKSFQGDNVIFTTGTDEHGQKVQKAAEKKNISLENFCQDNSYKFKRMSQIFSISSTHFIRTSEERHKKVVQEVWKKLESKNLIKIKNYDGWYCSNEESFINERDLTKINEGRLTQLGNTVEWTSEINHIYEISQFKCQIGKYLQERMPILPEHFNETILKNDLPDFNDISISRPKARVSWGVSLPGDENQTIYVWLDALCNYLTALNYPDEVGKEKPYYENFMHVIGKDIIKFHALYWPAFLLGLGLPLPRKILVHEHWIFKGKKMSKSIGNVVNPFDLSKKYGSEAVRLYLLSEGPEYYDAAYDPLLLQERYNEFIETYINALNRLFQEKILTNGEIASIQWVYTPEEESLIEDFNKTTEKFKKLMDDHHIRKSYISLQEKFVLINKYIGKTEVWRISEPTLKNKIIYINFEMIRIIALLLISFIPKISDGVLKALKIPEIERNHKNLEFRKFQKGENENLLKNFHYENNESCFLKVDFQDKHFFFRKKIDKI